MTEIIINGAMFLAAVLGAAYTPWAKRIAGARTDALRRWVFKLLVGSLYVFSLNETITETGITYGLAFSVIPLIAGAVVLNMMKSREE